MIEKTFITPCAEEKDGAAIQKAVDIAAQNDLRTVVIPNTKIWHLDQPVRLPGYVTVILDGAEIHSDGVAFTSANRDREMRLGTEAEQIYLIGTKGATIIGKMSPQILLKNVKDFGIRGICFAGGEGVKLSHCRYGKVQKLQFSQSLHGVLLTEGCNNILLDDVLAETLEEAVLWLGGEESVWGRSNEIYDTSLSRLDAKTGGAPAVAIRSSVRVANLFLHDVTDRTEGEGASVELCGTGTSELADLTLRGVDSKRISASVDKNADGVFLGNLRGGAPAIDPNATRILTADEREELLLPDLSEEKTNALVNANDPIYFGDTDAQSLQNALDAAAGKALLIPRYNARTGESIRNIDKTLRIPSDTTVILLDAHLRLEDFTYCNLFTNEKGAKNIRILGVGSAVLDSGKFNGLKEKNADTLGFGPITDNALLFFAGVEGLKTEHLHLIQNRWYCVYCVACQNARLADLDLCAHPNFPDMGGIRLHGGCRNVLVENVTGLTGEDAIVLCAEDGDDRLFASACTDVSDIHIRTVKVNASRASMVLLKARDGRKIHRIRVENLLDCSLPEQKKLPFGCIQVGNTESKNISDLLLRDMTGRGESTVQMGGESQNVTLSNIHSFGSSASSIRSLPLPETLDYKLTAASADLAERGLAYRATLQNWTAKSLFFRCLQGSRYMRGTATSIITDKKKFIGCVLDLRNLRAEKLLVENVLAERIGEGIFASGAVTAEIQNFTAAEIGRNLATCGEGCRVTVAGETVPVKRSKPL